MDSQIVGSGVLRALSQAIGRIVLVSVVGLLVGLNPAAAGIVVDSMVLPSPLWGVFGSPQFISVVPFSDADVGAALSDRLTIGVRGFNPVVGNILEPANDVTPEHALLASIFNTNWLFGPIAFPLGPDVPAEDWIIFYNVGIFANVLFWSDPFIDPPDAPPAAMVALLPPDVAAALVTGPSVDQNADGTYTLPIPNNSSAQAPEPLSLLLIGAGLSGLGLLSWRRKGTKQ